MTQCKTCKWWERDKPKLLEYLGEIVELQSFHGSCVVRSRWFPPLKRDTSTCGEHTEKETEK